MPEPGSPDRRALIELGLRVGAILVALIGAVVGLFRLLAGGGDVSGLGLFGFYVLVTLLLWGLNGFFFRRLPLSIRPLLLFSAAIFGALFLVAYLLGSVMRPWLTEMAGLTVGLIHLSDLVFYLFAFITIAGAAGCAFSRNIIYSAWSLLFAFLGVAALYVLLGADFPAVTQVLIYVGGILVLILFAIMLTKQIGEDPKLTNAHLGLPIGAGLAVATVATLGYMAVAAPWKIVPQPSYEPVSAKLGVAFLTEYLLPFEVASVVLLAALVGAVIIARKEIKETSEVEIP